MVDVPSAQERVTAKATPAEAMAWTKADSRVAEEGRKEKKRGAQVGITEGNIAVKVSKSHRFSVTAEELGTFSPFGDDGSLSRQTDRALSEIL